MKYVVVDISGRQFYLEQGKYYDLNKIPGEINQSIIFDRVLFFDDGSQFSFGRPYLETVTVKATITKHPAKFHTLHQVSSMQLKEIYPKWMARRFLLNP